jgi:hypothetical protein
METNIEKNKQVLEFISIIEEVEQTKMRYSLMKEMFIDFIEYVNMSWDEYKDNNTVEQIKQECEYFSNHVYLPF